MKLDCAERRALLLEAGQSGGDFTTGSNEAVLEALGVPPAEIENLNRRSEKEGRDSVVIYAETHALTDLQPLLPCASRAVWDSWKGDCRLLPHL